jgi:hypothetical protein
MQNIIFTHNDGFDFFPPTPAIKIIPDWYKNTPEYMSGKKLIEDAKSTSTIKKCIPVLDAMTAGYILYTQVDVQVTQVDDKPYYQWASQDAISFHPIVQAPLHPNKNDAPYPKWSNPYGIKTPKGYSTLFVPPLHNPNGIFTVLPGLVDTDSYFANVNFPFVLNDVKWEGMIPAGTPMVQVIPIKRDVWKMGIGLDKERKEKNLVSAKLTTMWFNSYKKQFWIRKEYK